MNMDAFAVPFTFRRPQRRLVSLASTLVLMLAALALSGCSDDEPTVVFPTAPDPEQNDWLFAVFGTAADDVYAVGNKGAMLHFDGTDWSLTDMGVTAAIVDVWGPGDGTVYACGHNGRLWRNTGTGWSSLDSGTSKDLFGLGNYGGSVYACGKDGALRRQASGTWVGSGAEIIKRNSATGAAEDTLSLNRDIASLVTVSYYGFGGAYIVPDYDGEIVGMNGTDGMILGADDEVDIQGNPLYDWRLRPIKGSQLADSEWVLTSISSSSVNNDNYLGTSEGWLFQLTEEFVWSKLYPQITQGNGYGIRGLWRDADGNIYMVTDEGQLVYQTFDYSYVTGSGERVVLLEVSKPLMDIWGSDPANLFLVGYVEGQIIHCSHDPVAGTFDFEYREVTFPDKGLGLDPGYDHLGLPRR